MDRSVRWTPRCGRMDGMPITTRSLVAIDPGLNSMGVALWGSVRNDSTTPETFLLKAPRKLDLAPRALWIARQLASQLPRGFERGDFVCEYPAWHGIQLGWAAGDLQKLVFLVGVLAGYFNTAHSFTPVTPKEWKGQLPKDVVKRRLVKKFGPGATREWERDMWDAVGIGLWKLGRF
jgi:hypothetical protein